MLADRYAAKLAAVAQRVDYFPITEQFLLPQFVVQSVQASNKGEGRPLAPAIGAPWLPPSFGAEPFTTVLVAKHLGEYRVFRF